MSLAIADFKRPTGRLAAAWFTDDLSAALTVWLAEAITLSTDEAVQVAWVYHRAYQTLADDRALTAATTAADDIRESFTDAQLTRWQTLADGERSRFDALTGSSGGPVITPVGFVTP